MGYPRLIHDVRERSGEWAEQKNGKLCVIIGITSASISKVVLIVVISTPGKDQGNGRNKRMFEN